MNIRISKLAQNEIDDAVSWYDSQSKGLGTRFLDDLDRTIRRIAAYPFSCVEIEPDLRRCLLTRFLKADLRKLDKPVVREVHSTI